MGKRWMVLLLFTATAHAQKIDSADIHVLEHIALTRTPAQSKVFKFIANANTYVNIAVPAGLLVGGIASHDRDMRMNALYVASSTATTALLNAGLKKIFKRSRPFRAHPDFTPVITAGGYSLPSGHSSSTFSNAMAVSRAYPKWYVIAPSFLWAGAVGYSRMYLGVHYPSDVMAGAALGVGTAYSLGFIRP
ncbi:phosphatase PAP2 family protein [uncultured Chitinophaga sp.]|uniref:phosphatase PAP2 family protein n=1 Tax=uncultured Chitinophaga sp. TaxID=339340 RepID=UPI0025D4E6F3|nr:phosphatase PAP2 family protein [uncultured Chitinophaga sp.]